jgi:hypothetical protein
MSKYQPLAKHLEAQGSAVVTITFAEIDRLLGDPLPPSARQYRPWWANEREGSHVQARAWLDAGWKVDAVDLSEERVTFRRSS